MQLCSAILNVQLMRGGTRILGLKVVFVKSINFILFSTTWSACPDYRDSEAQSDIPADSGQTHLLDMSAEE